MTFEMTMRENLMLMALLTTYRRDTAKNQRACRHRGLVTDLFWAERNRAAKKLYRRLTVAT